MSNISYPHPVLGNSDDITGSLSINIDGEIKDNELSIIQKDLTLDNEYFEKLIKDKKAQIIHKITCSSTLFSKIILGELKDSIDCNKISKQVKVETKIIALDNIDKYTDDSFNDDSKLGANKGVFKVKKGQIIGVCGRFFIDLDDEFRKGVSSVIDFDQNDINEPISIDPDGNKITISYPHDKDNPNCHDIVTTFSKSGGKKYKNLFLNLFIIPAFTEAFRFLIESKENNSYDNKVEKLDWAKLIHNKVPDPIDAEDDPYALAQEFLQQLNQDFSGSSSPIPIFNAYNELFKN